MCVMPRSNARSRVARWVSKLWACPKLCHSPSDRAGRSRPLRPALSLGLWHNFGHAHSFETQRATLLRAFDLGITHIDLANNYGPPAGAAEECFGAVVARDLRPYRDELVVSTKAGYWMWNGPYGDGE